MKDYETFNPIVIQRAKGSYLYSDNGSSYIDAISSWWSKSLGHGHPQIIGAIKKQLDQYEHVIGTNTCQRPLVELSEQLCELIPHIDKVFYSGDGSCAVEIAMKMALQAQLLDGHTHKNQFLSLANGYHGETALTLSISDQGIYKDSYHPILHQYPLLAPLYVSGPDDLGWTDAADYFEQQLPKLNLLKEYTAAIIIEPIVQGAGGMRIYSPDFLSRLTRWARDNQIWVIADEIMTGIGRTGRWLASEYANIEADLICLSKGLTSGTVAFSAVLTHNQMFNRFYDDYDKGKSFLHSQTFSGNAIGATAALATLNTIQSESLLEYVTNTLQSSLLDGMKYVAEKTQALENIRYLGGIVAADLKTTQKRIGFEVFKNALSLGAFLRPLGNTIYWLPPLNMSVSTVEQLATITVKAIEATK